jgi:hypothetical protein
MKFSPKEFIGSIYLSNLNTTKSNRDRINRPRRIRFLIRKSILIPNFLCAGKSAV